MGRWGRGAWDPPPAHGAGGPVWGAGGPFRQSEVHGDPGSLEPTSSLCPVGSGRWLPLLPLPLLETFSFSSKRPHGVGDGELMGAGAQDVGQLRCLEKKGWGWGRGRRALTAHAPLPSVCCVTLGKLLHGSEPGVGRGAQPRGSGGGGDRVVQQTGPRGSCSEPGRVGVWGLRWLASAGAAAPGDRRP